MNKQQLKQLNKLLIMWKEIHKNKYDYSKVEYVTIHTKVTIVCPEHGEFEQLASTHLAGAGCKHCGDIKQRKNTMTNLLYYIMCIFQDTTCIRLG